MSIVCAIDKSTNKYINIDEIDETRGTYSCINCGCELIARKGSINIHRFAHKESPCSDNKESLIHLHAKHIMKYILHKKIDFYIVNNNEEKIKFKYEFAPPSYR